MVQSVRQARAHRCAYSRLSLGNPGDVKPVGEGVSELRIDYGPDTGFILCNVGRS